MSRASSSFARCSLAVERETRARYASSLLVSAWPPMSAASIVARAVSPTSAATSTRLAAATMIKPSVLPTHPASNDGSARADLIARDTPAKGCKSRRHAWRSDGGRHEARATARGAVFDLAGTAPQGPCLSRHRGRRDRVRVRPAPVRSGHRRDQATAVRAAGRDRAHADETMRRGGRLVARARGQVQRLLHARCVALRHVQRRLRALFSRRFAGAHFSPRAVLAGAVRHRDRLCGGGVTSNYSAVIPAERAAREPGSTYPGVADVTRRICHRRWGTWVPDRLAGASRPR